MIISFYLQMDWYRNVLTHDIFLVEQYKTPIYPYDHILLMRRFYVL